MTALNGYSAYNPATIHLAPCWAGDPTTTVFRAAQPRDRGTTWWQRVGCRGGGLLKVWIGNRGCGFGSAALAINTVIATIIKTVGVVLTEIDIVIITRPGGNKFTARNNIHICCILAIELSINSSCA